MTWGLMSSDVGLTCKGQYGVGVGVGVGGARGFMVKEDSKTGEGDSAAISVVPSFSFCRQRC